MKLKHFFYKRDKLHHVRKYLGGLIKIKTKKSDEKIKTVFYFLDHKLFSLTKKNKIGIVSKKVDGLSQQSEVISQQIDAIKLESVLNEIRKLEENMARHADEIRHYPEMISRLNQRNLATAFAHQKIFSQFENCFAGKDVVLLATGPSLNEFEPMKDVVYVGVNNTFQQKEIDVDYLFIHDYRGAKKYISEANAYRREKCLKFYGICADFIEGALVPKSEVLKSGAYYYHADYEQTAYWEPHHVYDISSQPLGCRTSITFPAMQFILWGNPRKIYLVGCDSSGKGHFGEASNSPYDANCTISEWKQLKHLASIYYPDVEIISVNPVGLKGMFKDYYQKGE